MQNVLQMFQKHPLNSESFSLISMNTFYKKEINRIITLNKQIAKDYQKIIHILFTNTGIDNHSRFLEIKDELYLNCLNNQIKNVDLLTRKIIAQNGFLLSLNEQTKTSGIIGLLEVKENIFIPRSIEYHGQEYILNEIFESAFEKVMQIRTIEFSEDSEVCKINSRAFHKSSLKSICIPQHVTLIENGTFSKCETLQKIEFSEKSTKLKIEKNAFPSSLTSLTLPSCAKLEEGWCHELYNLNDVKITPNIKANICLINDELLVGKSDSKSNIFDIILFANRKIEHAKIPSFIKIIGSYSFASCNRLLYLEFSYESQLKMINEYAFEYCDYLEYVWIPREVEIINKYAFYCCRVLEMIEFEKNSKLKIIGNSSFYDSKIEKISIPDSVIRIGESAFSQSLYLRKVTFSENSQLRLIDNFAFWRTAIDNIYFPPSVIQIGHKVFSDCDSFENLIISNDSELISIGSEIIAYSNVKSILVPQSVLKIHQFAFAKCEELKKITFSDNSSLNKFEIFTFFESSIESLSIPPSISEISDGAFYKCYKLQIIEIQPGSKLKLIDLIYFGVDLFVILMVPAELNEIVNHNYEGRNIQSEIDEYE